MDDCRGRDVGAEAGSREGGAGTASGYRLHPADTVRCVSAANESRPDGLAIRRARTSDVPTIKSLVDFYAGKILLEKNLVTLYEAVQEFWVAERDDELIGCGALHVMWADLGEVRIEHGDVFGDAVNIAARIEAQAGPGEVLFGESVWLSMNRAGVRAEDLGPREFKGVPEPVRVFRLQRVRLPRGVDEALRELPSPERLEEAQSEVRGHLRDAMQAAMLRLEEVFPNVADRARLLLGAGLAAMAAIVVAVLLLIRLGGRP